MQFVGSSGFNSIPSATGGIARLACARLGEMGKDPIVMLSKVGLTPEGARDPAVRLEARTQIKLLELAAEELHDEWLGFHLARSFDLREIGLVLTPALSKPLHGSRQMSSLTSQLCDRRSVATRTSLLWFSLGGFVRLPHSLSDALVNSVCAYSSPLPHQGRCLHDG